MCEVRKKGETLYSISRKYNLSVSDIQAANPNLNASNMKLGQRLKIPQKEDQEKSTGKPAKDRITHTVQPGETLFSISQKYDVSVAEIKEWNGLSSNSIEVGQKLTVGK